MKKKYLISFGKVLPVGLILTLSGAGGLAYILMNTQPFLGPRWLLFFFTTLFTCGLGLPILTLLQNRFSKKGVTEGILLRETILFAVYIDLLLWLQLGRALNNVTALLLGVGFVLLEVFLRISEKAVFQADEDIYE
ncbi:MAG TPA: hypothetical protein DCK95_00925 [Anaerolineaceae bacterium]|nr:hypothetical protein [Anaerolineaceae bacterium]